MAITFNSSDGPTLGVEVELLLVDRRTRELVSRSQDILTDLGRAHPGGEHPRAKHELLQCTLELNTGVCKTVSSARADLEASLREARAAADEHGVDLLCSGTHPFSAWADQKISPNPRYAKLVEDLQWPARRLLIFGIHCHVGVRSPEKAVAIANALREYIPHFLALSASSPYWRGHDTGLASARAKVFEGLPTAGVPHAVDDWASFEQFMRTLLSAGAISSIREVWWDIRPHPGFGTVELRMFDGVPTLTEVCALAALSQCVVEWMDSLLDRGYTLPKPHDWIVRQNKWFATRHGLDAEIITDTSGHKVFLRHAVEELVAELDPVARRLGCSEELEGVYAILTHGSSTTRQRRIVEQGGTLVDVVDALVRELEADEVGA